MKNKTIIKNTSMLYLMNIAKIIFPLITLPYLTRVLSVPAFGVVSYVKAVMQYMQLFVDFGFIVSGTKDIVLAEGNKELESHEIGDILLGRILLGILCFVFTLILALIIPILNDFFVFTLLSYLVVFLSIFLFDFYFRGIEKMEIISIRFIVMKTISTVFTFVLVKNDTDLLLIPILDILGTFVAIILITIQLRRLNVSIKFNGLLAAIQKIRNSFYFFASNIATTAYNALNTFLIGIFLTSKDVAFWSICMQMIGAVQTLYTPISNGIYPQMVREKKLSLLLNTMKIFMPIVIIGCIISVLLSKYLLLIVGGAKYVEATQLFQMLIPVLFFSFPVFLFGWPGLGAINRQKENTYATFIAAIFQIIVLAMLIISNHFTLHYLAILRCTTEFVLMISVLGYIYRFRLEFKKGLDK